MKRMQVQLTENELKLLRLKARDQGTSVASIVRKAVDLYLGSPVELPSPGDHWQASLGVVGRFSAGRGNTSEEHDRFLEPAYGE